MGGGKVKAELTEEELLLLEEVLREEIDQLIESAIYGPADPEEALERLTKLVRLARKLWGGAE
jgi:hypothetical protein